MNNFDLYPEAIQALILYGLIAIIIFAWYKYAELKTKYDNKVDECDYNWKLAKLTDEEKKAYECFR